MYLMPQLPTALAIDRASELSRLDIDECRARRSVDDELRTYSPTGGSRVTDLVYNSLCDDIALVARGAGYDTNGTGAKGLFDIELAIFMHKKFLITDNEAAKAGVWNHLSCCALPDLVRWRFHGKDATPPERFLSGPKNMFERLWWRAHAYYDREASDPYWLVREIGEDESVGMMERTTLSGMRPLVVIVLRTLIACHKENPTIPRSELMRDSMKRLLRLGGFVALEGLGDRQLESTCRAVIEASVGDLGEKTA